MAIYNKKIPPRNTKTTRRTHKMLLYLVCLQASPSGCGQLWKCGWLDVPRVPQAASRRGKQAQKQQKKIISHWASNTPSNADQPKRNYSLVCVHGLHRQAAPIYSEFTPATYVRQSRNTKQETSGGALTRWLVARWLSLQSPHHQIARCQFFAPACPPESVGRSPKRNGRNHKRNGKRKVSLSVRKRVACPEPWGAGRSLSQLNGKR